MFSGFAVGAVSCMCCWYMVVGWCFAVLSCDSVRILCCTLCVPCSCAFRVVGTTVCGSCLFSVCCVLSVLCASCM